ncbi:MAG: hypothetical protein H7834_10610 [Magnetococcus sp. YQC-9]
MSCIQYDDDIHFIKYSTEFLETGVQDHVVASFVTATPFAPIQVGEIITMPGLPQVSEGKRWEGVKLAVEKIEHGIWETNGVVTQKTLIWGKVINATRH